MSGFELSMDGVHMPVLVTLACIAGTILLGKLPEIWEWVTK